MCLEMDKGIFVTTSVFMALDIVLICKWTNQFEIKDLEKL